MGRPIHRKGNGIVPKALEGWGFQVCQAILR